MPGWAGRGHGEHCSPPEEGGRAQKRLLLPERRDLLCSAKRQGSLRAAFVQGEKMMAAGSAASHLPAQTEPKGSPSKRSSFLLPQRDHLGWGAQDGPNSQRPSFAGLLFPQPCRVHPKPGYIMDGGSRVQPLREPSLRVPPAPAPLLLLPAPQQVGKSSTPGNSSLKTCNRIARGHSPPSCLLCTGGQAQ